MSLVHHTCSFHCCSRRYLAVFVCIFWYQRIDDAAILVLALMVLTQVFNIVVDHAIPTCKMQSRCGTKIDSLHGKCTYSPGECLLRRHVALNNRIEERNSLKTAASKGEVSGLEKSINSQSYTDLTVMQNILVPRKSTKSSKVHTLRDAVRNGRLSLLPEDTVRQVLLNELCDPTDDMHRISQYMDIVLQFGFVVMFSACMPLAPLLAFANNMWEFRGEVTLATYVRRRTTAEGTGGIGIWYVVIHADTDSNPNIKNCGCRVGCISWTFSSSSGLSQLLASFCLPQKSSTLSVYTSMHFIRRNSPTFHLCGGIYPL